MNEQSAVLRRLLNIYPVDSVKKHWPMEGSPNKDEILDAVVQRATQADVFAFAKQNAGLTKQNVYLFNLANLGKEVPKLLENADDLCESEERSAGNHFYLANLHYKVFVRPENEEREVLFKWPVCVSLTRKRMVIRCTTMEKNVRSYFPTDIYVISLGRTLEEEMIVKEIRDKVHKLVQTEGCDMNKGVKHLWETDVIDSPSTKYKGAKSTITETMDGSMLIKRDQPATYQKSLQSALLKTPFFLLKPESKNPPHFSVNPTAGELYFTTFSPSEDHVNYVLGEILKHN